MHTTFIPLITTTSASIDPLFLMHVSYKPGIDHEELIDGWCGGTCPSCSDDYHCNCNHLHLALILFLFAVNVVTPQVSVLHLGRTQQQRE